MQRIAVIGLGRFGMTLARRLAERQVEVIAIDGDARLVDEIKDDVTLAVCLDATDEHALLSQDIGSVDVCVVAIGEGFESSLLTATHAKRLGVKRLICRAQTSVHAEIFRRVGADEVIQPETEAGENLARRLSNPLLEDVIELADGYSLIEIRAPHAFHGKTIEQIALRAKYQVNLVALKRVIQEQVDNAESRLVRTYVPQPNYVINKDDLLLLVGTDAALAGLPS